MSNTTTAHRRVLPLLAAAVALVCLSTVVTPSHADSIIQFNELMYHPAGNEPELEWVELLNALSYDMDISGWELDGGIEYTFPIGTTIPSEGYLVIAKSPAALETQLGITNAFGPFEGQLSNGGESIRLENNSGRDMDELAYGDGGDWPVAPDGSGVSLAKIAPFTASPPADNWHFSTRVGGTPGAENFPGTAGPIVTTLVDRDATWRYHDGGTNLGTAWRSPAYDDNSWSNAPAAFNSDLEGNGGYLVTDGLVQRHRAEDITGLADNEIVSAWPDSALADGTAQDATAAGDPRYVGNVVNGRAVVRFDGSTDELRAAQSPGIDPTDGFVYFIVLKANGAADNGGVADGNGDYMFDRESSPDGTPLVSLKAVNGRFGYQTRYDGGGIGGPVSTTAISQTAFQIVALRRNRTAGQFEIWVDGALEASTSDNGNNLTPSPINIGRHATSISGGFVGDVADVLIYERELPEDELHAVGAYLATEYDVTTAFTGTVGRTPLSPTTPTCYFRETFTFDGDPANTDLELTSWIADGAVFYLNGQELTRSNMPSGDVTFLTSALTDVVDPMTPTSEQLPASLLISGTNTLAAEVHRAAGGTNLFFAAELESTETPPPPLLPPALAINEIAAVTNADWWVELANLSEDGLNPSGCVVSVAGDLAREYVITNTSLPAGAFLLLTESEIGFDAFDEDPIFLYGPDRTTILDARVAKRSLRGRHEGDWLRPTIPTPGTTNTFAISDDIVINEIMYHHQATNDGITFAESAEEWIELYNRGTQTADLAGWKLSGGISFTFPAGTTLAADAYLVVSNFTGKLSNRSETIVLKDAVGNPADEVHYVEGGRWPSWADGGGSSLELRAPDADNSVAEAWAASDEGQRATWQTYTYRTTATASSVGPDNQWKEFVLGLLDSGTILIDDISVIEDPDGAATELIPTRDFESGTGDWRIVGNHRHSEVVLDPDDGGNHVLRLVASGPTEHMHNHASITLAGGQSVENGKVHETSFRAKWLGGCRLLNTRLYFNRAPETFVLDVPMTNGTPGAQNSTWEANIGPTYTGFTHDPAVPSATTPVTVSVAAADPDGVVTMKTWYAVDGGTWQVVDMVLTNNGLYACPIPAQSASSVVQFYVEGEDALGAVSTFPAGGRDSRALYKVDDGQASATLHNLRIVMTDADADFMDTDIHLMSNEQLGCTVIFDERDVYYDVGVRYKSSERGRVSDQRIGFKLGFNADHPLLGVHRSVAIDRSAGQVVGQREMLANQMMNRAGGSLSKYTDLIKVLAPKNEHTSSAELQLARFGDVFLDGQFENGRDGTIFEYELIYYPTTANAEGYKLPSPDRVTGTVINDKGADKEHYRWPFLIKNHRNRDDYSAFIAFAKVFGQSGSSFNEQIGTVADVDQWLRYMAVAVADGHGDSYPSGSNRHNAMFYVRPTDGRVLFFPHDMDFNYNATRALIPNSDLQKLIGTDERERLYYGHMWDILQTAYNPTYMQTWTDRLGALLPQEDFAGYLSFISSRHTYLLGQLNARVAPAYPFAVTTPSGEVAAPTVGVEGQAWLDVREIVLDGQDDPLELTWTASGTGTSRTYAWQTTVPLDPGPNVLTFLAYGFQGELVGSNTITITSSSSDRPLQDHLRVTELMADPRMGSTYEFIELHNTGATTLDLAGVHFDAGITFDFSLAGFTSLAARAYCVIVSDLTAFDALYETNGMTIAGVFEGKLANEGELVEIRGPLNEELLRFRYQSGRGWPLPACGAGHSLVPLESAVPGQHEGSLYYGGNWRASAWADGSPGGPDPEPAAGVTINEIIAHTDFTNAAYPGYDSNDKIELFNRGTNAVGLRDYTLTDDRDDLTLWRLPNVVLAPGDRITFDEITGFHAPITNGFGLDKAGEEILLSYRPATGQWAVVDGVRFKGQENGAAWGRYEDGDAAWYALLPTPDASNPMPWLRPVISEVMYHPPDNPTNNTRDEYIEICNPTDVAVELWNTSGTWRVAGDVDYRFPENTLLPPDGHIVLVSFDPTNTPLRDGFLSAYGLTNGEAVLLGPYSSPLDNRTERIALERPQAGDVPGDPVSWVLVDEVIYFHQDPWPPEADGTGRSLARKHTRWSGNDPANWYASFEPTPGKPSPTHGPASVPDWWLAAVNPAWSNDFSAAAAGDQDDDGLKTWQEYLTGTDPLHPDSTLMLRVRHAVPGIEVVFDTLDAGTSLNGAERRYSLEHADTLAAAAFTNVPGYTDLRGDNTTRIYSPPEAETGPDFYRLKVRVGP